MSLSVEHGNTLLDVARASIVHGVEHGAPLAVEAEDFDASLRELRATFVTLEKQGRLCGCIGVIDPVRPLVADVSHNAQLASSRDPRFEAVRRDEIDELRISISILTVPERRDVTTREQLLAALDTGSDGLIIGHGERRATFLPVMWQQLPQPEDFLRHLESKGRQPVGRWHGGMSAWTFKSEYIRQAKTVALCLIVVLSTLFSSHLVAEPQHPAFAGGAAGLRVARA